MQELKLLNAKIVFSENVPQSDPNTENESYTQCSSWMATKINMAP